MCRAIVLLLVVVLSGCGTGPEAPRLPSLPEPRDSSSSDKSRNESDLVGSWERFIESAKAREADAAANYVERRRGRPGKVKVNWGITDVVKSDAITSPYIGKVDITVLLTDEYSTGRFQYSLQFVPSGVGWRYRGGKKQRFDRSGADSEPLDYPDLEDEVLVLFTGGA